MSKSMKGMQVVEVIFILIIMIIVTVVLVNMFTEMFGEGQKSISGQLKDINELHQGREAIRTCTQKCSSFEMNGDDSSAIEYCTQAVGIDLSGDGVVLDVDSGSNVHIALPPGQDNLCEEHIYCPMIGGSECKYGNRRLTMEECKKTLCRYYTNNGLTNEQAAKKIDQHWDLGECGIDEEPNWGGWIGPLCGTNINLTGAMGQIKPGTENNGASGVCDNFCNGAEMEGTTFSSAAESNCMSVLSCPDDATPLLEANNKDNPCDTDSLMGCCCLV